MSKPHTYYCHTCKREIDDGTKAFHQDKLKHDVETVPNLEDSEKTKIRKDGTSLV